MNGFVVLAAMALFAPSAESGARHVTTPVPASASVHDASGMEKHTLSELIEAACRRTVKLYGAAIAGEHGYGSGVLVSESGDVVTTLSILLEASNLRAVTEDGHVYPASIAHRDEYRQLAVLKLAARPQNLDTDAPVVQQMARAKFDFYELAGHEDIGIGDWVFTVGNPFKVAEGDERMSIMKGIVSGRAKMDAARGAQEFPYRGEIILVDAITSSPGSAGSAVVNLSGRLVGILGKPVRSQLTNTLLNYAYPVEEIVELLKDTRTDERPASRAATAPAGPGYHGILLSKIAYHKELPFVASVARNSPASAAGVRADDLIVSANGVAIPRGRAFTELCERLRAGDELSLIVKRGERLIPIRVTLSERPR